MILNKELYFSNKEVSLRVLYNNLIYIAAFHLKLVAIFNNKLKLGVIGRSTTFNTLEKNISSTDKTIWFHCASLGEYEQGLPVFEIIRNENPNHKIVLSFFSPSGYQIRKKSPIADVVVYLPLDTSANAKRFIKITHPELVLFVKYEVWPNYLHELKKRSIKTLLISALFRDNQIYFKSYGSFMKNALKSFTHIFTQNENSKTLLNSIGINNITVSGDTRFDRVNNQLKIDNTLDFISEFKQDKLCVIAGSTWDEDEELLVSYINNEANDKTKFIIAPHNIKKNQIIQLKNSIHKNVALYSEMESQDLSNFNVLILDTIGILSKVFSYADIAYIGGAMGNTGLHNTLEAAVFGVPIIIGKNYEKFPEAKDMVSHKGMYSVSNQREFNTILETLIDDKVKRELSGEANTDYIQKNKGAVIQISDFVRI